MLIALLCSVLVISACGGGGGGGSNQSAGIGGTGISAAKGTVQGKVTEFGSIYVNGVKFNTDDSLFTVDGIVGATQDDLAIGMIVTLTVETLEGVYTGKALEVDYDDEVQGWVMATPVDVAGSGGSQKTFKVFGQTVTIDETGTVFKGTSFDDLAMNDVVEISGFRASPTEITATYVEWKEVLTMGSEVELRGTVGGYLPPVQQFMLDGMLITFDNNTDIELEGSGGLANGLFVEVEGTYQGAFIYAEEIEEENEGFGDELDDVSLQGLISSYVSLANFRVNGQLVDASQASLEPANAAALLANGVEVEVEGDIVAGVLIAEELEVRSGETRLKAFVSFVYADNKRFRVSYFGVPGEIEVQTNSQTLFDDESPAELENFSVADMDVGDFVRVRGTESADKVIAETVKRLDSADPDDSELEGQVDSFVANSSITVLGIAYGVDVDTDYENSSGGSISSADFFTALANGADRVEIKDDVPADGIADDVALDD